MALGWASEYVEAPGKSEYTPEESAERYRKVKVKM